MTKLDLILGWLWCFCSFGLTAYVVFWKGYSGWWFALTWALVPSSNSDDEAIK